MINFLRSWIQRKYHMFYIDHIFRRMKEYNVYHFKDGKVEVVMSPPKVEVKDMLERPPSVDDDKFLSL